MKLVLKIAGVFYSGLLFYIFFLARRRPHATLFRHRLPANIVPLRNKIHDMLSYGGMYPNEQWNFLVDIFGNIFLFIPIAFFLRFVFCIKNPWIILFIAGTISACVEFTQFVFSIGVADVDDIILNTLGAIFGVVFLILLKKWLPRLYLIFDA